MGLKSAVVVLVVVNGDVLTAAAEPLRGDSPAYFATYVRSSD